MTVKSFLEDDKFPSSGIAFRSSLIPPTTVKMTSTVDAGEPFVRLITFVKGDGSLVLYRDQGSHLLYYLKSILSKCEIFYYTDELAGGVAFLFMLCQRHVRSQHTIIFEKELGEDLEGAAQFLML